MKRVFFWQISGDAKCVLEKTLIQNFATGVSCTSGGNLKMVQAIITDCGNGLEVSDAAKFEMSSSEIVNNSGYAVFMRTKADNVIEAGEKKKIVSNFDELGKLIP